MNNYTDSGAIISDCKKYRYRLWRIWDADKGNVMFVLHNPSTADENNDDPTVRRCVNYAKSWGYGGIYICNLYPYRATNPKDLLNKPFEEISPPQNMYYINQTLKKCSLHVLAYGNPAIKDTTPVLFDNIYMCLGLTKKGNPKHPLYLPSNLMPINLNNALKELHKIQ